MPDEEFKVRAGIYWLAQELVPLLKQVRELEKDPDKKAALERKWILLYAMSVVIKRHYGEDGWRRQVKKLHKGDWQIEDDKKGVVLLRIFNKAKSAVILAYLNSKKYNKSFVHRNWMRAKQTPNDISEAVEMVLSSEVEIGEIPG